MMRLIDLHSHSTASDGSDSPAELVRKAEALGLGALALTDHDTLSGLNEAQEAARGKKLEFIRGCELSARWDDNGEIHILGLWIPAAHSALRRFEEILQSLRERREQRNRIIVEHLNALGCSLDYEEVLTEAGGESVGRPHIARVLLRKGYVGSMREAFIRWLGKGGGAYAPKEVLRPEDAIRLLVSVGATAALAHPKLTCASNERLERIVPPLKAFGLSALEAYHGEHSGEDTRFCVETAAAHGLALCGGSDYHGKLKPAIALGKGKGNLRVPARVLEELKEQRRERGLPL
jgi:predicted metal-dependent phosphoesterase TrpH